VAQPAQNLGGGEKCGWLKCLMLGEQHYFVCDTVSQSTK